MTRCLSGVVASLVMASASRSEPGLLDLGSAGSHEPARALTQGGRERAVGAGLAWIVAHSNWETKVLAGTVTGRPGAEKQSRST